MFDFEEANRELGIEPMQDFSFLDTAFSDAFKELVSNFNDLDELFTVENKSEALEAVVLACEARKLVNEVEEKRKLILKPHQDYVKTINKISAELQDKCKKSEDCLKLKIKAWMQEDGQTAFQEEEKLSVESGTLYKKKNWTFQIENEFEIPNKYKSIDLRAINADIRAGVREIPGIEIFEDETLELKLKT